MNRKKQKKRKVRRHRAKAVVQKRLNGKKERERDRQTEGYIRAKAVVQKRLNGKKERETDRQTEGYIRPHPHPNSHIHPN